jgi:hypothetical protein
MKGRQDFTIDLNAQSACYVLFIIALAMNCQTSLAQEKDKEDTTKWYHKSKVVKRFLGMITHDPVDDTPAFNVKSEDAYLPYQGKIIRKIIIRRIGFSNTVLDTTQSFQTLISKVADALHADTKEFVIRNNLFIKEGMPLNPYRVADNERTLRTLNFILDSRILIRPISKTSDSVDLIVLTRDVFSLGGSFEPVFPSRYKVIVQDINAGGMGQRIQVAGLYDIDRKPHVGYEWVYQKTNLMGSFIDGSVGYTLINTGSSLGNENETAFYFRLNRPLYHPFARWAGGLELSNNISTNVYKRPDSLFAAYRYTIQDAWAGYSFGHKRLPTDLKENRNRAFVALRGFQQFFVTPPNVELSEPDRYAYRSRVAFLSQLTFFRQDFYKTQYVVGFGRTEDIPYGYRASLTAGWEKELGLMRPYFGSEVYYNRITPAGTILTYTAKLATYTNSKRSEDGLFSLNFRRFSRVYQFGNTKIRHQIETGYAWLFNQNIKRGIDIRDINGIVGFSPDSLTGTQRLTLSEEAVIFTLWKVLGFRIAPLGRIDLAMINQKSPLIRKENFYAGISTGVRARNENLIFNTIEARIFFYPKTVERVQHFGFSITTNFYIKYPTNLVNKPSTVFN